MLMAALRTKAAKRYDCRRVFWLMSKVKSLIKTDCADKTHTQQNCVCAVLICFLNVWSFHSTAQARVSQVQEISLWKLSSKRVNIPQHTFTTLPPSCLLAISFLTFPLSHILLSVGRRWLHALAEHRARQSHLGSESLFARGWKTTAHQKITTTVNKFFSARLWLMCCVLHNRATTSNPSKSVNKVLKFFTFLIFTFCRCCFRLFLRKHKIKRASKVINRLWCEMCFVCAFTPLFNTQSHAASGGQVEVGVCVSSEGRKGKQQMNVNIWSVLKQIRHCLLIILREWRANSVQNFFSNLENSAEVVIDDESGNWSLMKVLFSYLWGVKRVDNKIYPYKRLFVDR